MMGQLQLTGTIVKALSGFYYVDIGGRIITCRAKGKFRYEKTVPLVGDRVMLSQQPDGSGRLEEILPRRNAFQRPAVANIDQMVIVASGAIPVTAPFLIDRVISIAEGRGCEPVVCINKWDLEQPEALYDLYKSAGFITLKASAETGEGLEALGEILAGKISALTGNSGVGKSSLLNALDPSCSIQVGEVSEKLGRGRHTTRHIELFTLPGGGYIADTPGYSAFDAEKMTIAPPEELENTFRDFIPYLGKCRFVGCSHVKEQGCAVLAAVGVGEIHQSRHESYVRLYRQAKEQKSWK